MFTFSLFSILLLCNPFTGCVGHQLLAICGHGTMNTMICGYTVLLALFSHPLACPWRRSLSSNFDDSQWRWCCCRLRQRALHSQFDVIPAVAARRRRLLVLDFRSSPASQPSNWVPDWDSQLNVVEELRWLFEMFGTCTCRSPEFRLHPFLRSYSDFTYIVLYILGYPELIIFPIWLKLRLRLWVKLRIRIILKINL